FHALFGCVDESKKERNQIKSRLRIEETILRNDEVAPMVQDRIKIDRFTGGTVDGALFNSEPIWTTGDENITLCLSILKDVKPIEKKLLLMLLKDLWMEDLAIGGEKNVGRGLLIGQKASIYENSKIIASFEREASDKLS